jgi:RND family efflux transporter MFP subunit
VEEGQLLARLEDTDEKIQLERRQAEYKQIRIDYERGLKLIESQLISRSDFNKLEAQEATAKAALAAAKQNVEYTYLRAPFSGRIATRHVDNFEKISAQSPIYTLQDLSSVKIKVSVPESVMILVRAGNEPDLSAMFEEIPERRFPLSIDEVSTQADSKTNTFQVTLLMEMIDDFNVLPGMSVTVRGERVAQQLTEGAFYIPAHAVLEEEGNRFVYLAVRDAEPNALGQTTAKVSARQVETGKLSSLGLEVLSGLNEGDEVVVAGMSKMFDGLQVRLAGVAQ